MFSRTAVPLALFCRMLAGPGMRAQEIANLAWALAVMGEADVELLKELLRSAQAQRKDITLIESHQLYQVRTSELAILEWDDT